MLPRRLKIFFGIILVLTAALMGVYYLQQQQTVEVSISPQRVVWQKWGSRAVQAETVEALDFDQITSSPFNSIVTDTDRSAAERFRFTLSDSADFRLLYRALNHFAITHMSMRWRIGNDRELLYMFPPFEKDPPYDMEIPGGEDLALVKSHDQTSCVLVVTLTPSGILLNDTLRTLEELKGDIDTIIGQESVTNRFILIVATPETPLSVSTGLFEMIAAEGWHYQIHLNDPEE